MLHAAALACKQGPASLHQVQEQVPKRSKSANGRCCLDDRPTGLQCPRAVSYALTVAILRPSEKTLLHCHTALRGTGAVNI